ncbi:hypothetical protein M501DRAFT_1006453 [Patellaria atrata CBS 101060]|uniref:Phox-like protein n=1 Tax=Patellaria atrata CBS 101060 TaxID=1346257 RepID=A0A9P4S8C9_9PEZI|nr:hypothetical protein M501DRAFT_1006453 [Patellaria atrata CBS 101060]
MSPNLSISIPTTTTKAPAGSKAYTAYTVQLVTPLRTTTLQKRYSDFVNLNSALASETGSSPPTQLPSKTWSILPFASGGTVGNPEKVEERREGLEKYLRGILTAGDKKWRNSLAWRQFLGVDDPLSSAAAGAARGASKDISRELDPSSWLDAHREVKAELHTARQFLNKREQATNPSAQHEASAGAKKCLVKSATIIQGMEQALRKFESKDYSGEKLGEREIRRRKDLVGAVRKEREGLDGILNAIAVKSAVAAATQQVQERESDNTGFYGNSSKRVLGGPSVPETEQTRELDNQGLLMLQKDIMQAQDMDVELLGKTVRRMKELGIAINEELAMQAEMLDLLDEDVDRVATKVDIAKKRIGKIR